MEYGNLINRHLQYDICIFNVFKCFSSGIQELPELQIKERILSPTKTVHISLVLIIISFKTNLTMFIKILKYLHRAHKAINLQSSVSIVCY